jgi:hypothetical protein
MGYRKGDVVTVRGFESNQVITQNPEGDNIDVIEDGELGSMAESNSTIKDGEVQNIISEEDIIEKVSEIELE